MQWPCLLRYGGLMAAIVSAADTSSSTEIVITLSGSDSGLSQLRDPTGSYISYSSTIVLSTTDSSASSTSTASSGSMTGSASTMASSNSSQITVDSTSNPLSVLSGGHKTISTASLNGTSIQNSTASSTSSSAQPTNTTPCNGYPEFCSRKYGNITEVCAHNSPFVKEGSLAANQQYDVTSQLNNGIRQVQGQTQYVNGTVYLCHTSCDILNVGPLEDWLSDIAAWVAANPYDVVTVIIENGAYIPAEGVANFTTPIKNSGLERYAYVPPKIPMALDDWPTLAQMILTGKRAVIFLDYNTNQTAAPYLLDQFSQMWETPFDPVSRDFPCNVQRPPNLSDDDAKNRLYMTNHNLNTDILFMGVSLSVPTTTLLNVTNNVTGWGSLGEGVETCASQWGRPPNRLNVDYYNYGGDQPDTGTVMKVAAMWNNVTYNGGCCGTTTSGAESLVGSVIRNAASAAVVGMALGWALS